MAYINVFSDHGKNLLNQEFTGRRDIQIVYASEFLAHDGYDAYGPQSDIWSLFICVESLQTGYYTYYKYNEEYWYKGDRDLNYKLYSPSITSNYFVKSSGQNDNNDEIRTHYSSVWRVISYLAKSDNNVSKYDLNNVSIFINGIELDPKNVVKLE